MLSTWNHKTWNAENSQPGNIYQELRLCIFIKTLKNFPGDKIFLVSVHKMTEKKKQEAWNSTRHHYIFHLSKATTLSLKTTIATTKIINFRIKHAVIKGKNLKKNYQDLHKKKETKHGKICSNCLQQSCCTITTFWWLFVFFSAAIFEIKIYKVDLESRSHYQLNFLFESLFQKLSVLDYLPVANVKKKKM